MHATFTFREIYWKGLLDAAAKKTTKVIFDPKYNTLNRLPNDVKMSIECEGITLIPMSSPVLKYAKTIDEINKAKPQFGPLYHKELSLPLISRLASTIYSSFSKNNQTSCIDVLLKAGADVTMSDIHGITALGHAAFFGEDHLVDKLVKAGAKVKTSGDNGVTPIFLAAQAGHNICLEKLLHAGADVNVKTDNGFTPLMQAILAGHKKCVDTLIAAGADVNMGVTLKLCPQDIVKMKETAMTTVSSYLVVGDILDELRQKVTDKFGDLKTKEVQFTSLSLAVVADIAKCVPSLIEAGADVNTNSTSPLVCAADMGQIQLLNYLIRARADVNYSDYECRTALHIAARNGHIECVNRLAESHANVNKGDVNGQTPLMAAAENGHEDCVTQLIKEGADVNIADDMGNTALMWASMADHSKCLAPLIQAGADVNKANNHGYFSLMCAAMKGDDKWLSELIKAGANVNTVNKLGETAFTITSRRNHEQCMTILTTEGADVNSCNLHSPESADDYENRKDNTIIDIGDVEEEESDTTESLRTSNDAAASTTNDHGIIATNILDPQTEKREQVSLMIPVFEEKPVTVECGVHMGSKIPEV